MSKRKVFIDAGANVGMAVRSFLGEKANRRMWEVFGNRMDAYEYEIHVFEPLSGAFKLLERLQVALTLSGVKVFLYNKVCHIEDGTVMFLTDDDVLQTSAVRGVGAASTEKKHEAVEKEAVNFPDWVRENFKKEDHVVLKMDVEGSEYTLIEAMLANKAFAIVDEFYVEWHRGQRMLSKREELEQALVVVFGEGTAVGADGVYYVRG